MYTCTSAGTLCLLSSPPAADAHLDCVKGAVDQLFQQFMASQDDTWLHVVVAVYSL